MLLLKLTDSESTNMRTVYINAAHIIEFVPQGNGKVLLYLDSKLGPYNNYQGVNEDMNQILAQIRMGGNYEY